jgi:hypothetical protein
MDYQLRCSHYLPRYGIVVWFVSNMTVLIFQQLLGTLLWIHVWGAWTRILQQTRGLRRWLTLCKYSSSPFTNWNSGSRCGNTWTHQHGGNLWKLQTSLQSAYDIKPYDLSNEDKDSHTKSIWHFCRSSLVETSDTFLGENQKKYSYFETDLMTWNQECKAKFGLKYVGFGRDTWYFTYVISPDIHSLLIKMSLTDQLDFPYIFYVILYWIEVNGIAYQII